MKISPATRPPARSVEPAPSPVLIDEFGVARAVLTAPTTEEAWTALVDRLPPGGAYLACRLSVTTERVDLATAAVAAGLRAIGEKKKSGEPVPPSWVTRLGDLAVAELDALWAWDDASHAGAAVPAWVEIHHNPSGGHDRPVPASETSWARIARLYSRVMQQVGGLTDTDTAWDRLGGMDPERDADPADVEATKERGRALVRAVVHEKYADKETPT